MTEPSRRRVFVLGNASIDVTLSVPRLPLPGETLIARGITRAPGGKGLNQAVVAARCGVEVHFCAPLGTEAETDGIRAALAAEDFASLHLPDVGQPTDLSTLLVAEDGENCIVSTGDCAAALPVTTAEMFVAAMGSTDILLLQGNLSAAASLAAARKAGWVVFNTAPLRWPPGDLLALSRTVIANEVEAGQITGLADARASASLIARNGASTIVTLGASGCLLVDAQGATEHPASPATAVDTSGAGDTFCGVLVAALARGLAMPSAIQAAQDAASLAVSRPGCFVALPDATQLARLFH